MEGPFLPWLLCLSPRQGQPFPSGLPPAGPTLALGSPSRRWASAGALRHTPRQLGSGAPQGPRGRYLKMCSGLSIPNRLPGLGPRNDRHLEALVVGGSEWGWSRERHGIVLNLNLSAAPSHFWTSSAESWVTHTQLIRIINNNNNK